MRSHRRRWIWRRNVQLTMATGVFGFVAFEKWSCAKRRRRGLRQTAGLCQRRLRPWRLGKNGHAQLEQPSFRPLAGQARGMSEGRALGSGIGNLCDVRVPL